jgi:hypothetical protein
MDSAESVYKFALDQAKIDTTGVHPSAFKSLVSMHKQSLSRPEKRPAMDRELTNAVVTKFPAIKRFGA